jgi:hypothetical protein
MSAAVALAAVVVPDAAVVVLKTWKTPCHTAGLFYPHELLHWATRHPPEGI